VRILATFPSSLGGPRKSQGSYCEERALSSAPRGRPVFGKKGIGGRMEVRKTKEIRLGILVSFRPR